MGQDFTAATEKKQLSNVSSSDEQFMVTVHKTEKSTQQAVAGATYGLYDASGRLISSKTTDSNGKLMFYTIAQNVALEAHTPYYIAEIDAPQGYQLSNEKNYFYFCDENAACTKCAGMNENYARVENDGVIEVTDEKTPDGPEVKTYQVEISKVDATNGEELSGAQLKITNASGNLVESWTSGASTHFVSLKAGTYALTEIAPPDGYQTAESIVFTIDKDGTITSDATSAVSGAKVTMKDAVGDVTIPDKDIPTANVTPDDAVEEVIIPDEDAPKADVTTPDESTDVPQTGDTRNTAMWIFLLAFSLLAGIGIITKLAYATRKNDRFRQ